MTHPRVAPSRPVAPSTQPATLAVQMPGESDAAFMQRASASNKQFVDALYLPGYGALSDATQLLDIAKRVPLIPPHGQLSDAQGADTDQGYTDTSFRNLAFTQDAKLVVYAGMKRAGGGHLGSFAIELSLTAKANFAPIYFLPWRSKSMYQMTIPRRGTVAGVPDPDVFFTAAINGCSVFFSGNADAPTIFHAGIDSMQHGALPTNNSGKFWRDLLREREAGLRGQAKGLKTFGEVKASQYVNERSQDKSNAALVDKETADSRTYAAWLRGEYAGQLRITSVMPWGCVFGVRDAAGDWTFYLQENAAVTYRHLRRKTGLDKLLSKTPTRAEATSYTVNRPIKVSQVYPGRGHVQLSGHTDLDLV